MGIKWSQDELLRKVEKATAQNLARAAITLANRVKENISEPSNHGDTPSAPGEFPHKDTGRLRASIAWEVDQDAKTARVGTNVEYGKFLELGSSKMAARPFLRNTHLAMRDELARILTGKGGA